MVNVQLLTMSQLTFDKVKLLVYWGQMVLARPLPFT